MKKRKLATIRKIEKILRSYQIANRIVISRIDLGLNRNNQRKKIGHDQDRERKREMLIGISMICVRILLWIEKDLTIMF